MKNIVLYIFLFIGLSCIYGMCSKGDDTPGDNGNSDGYVEPELKPEGKWIYMTSGSLSPFYGPENAAQRPAWRKWIASKVTGAHAFKMSDGREYLGLSFENSDKYTRFLCDKLNSGGKEVLSMAVYSAGLASNPPEPGTFSIDIDNKQGYCWYYVYDANGNEVDSTRTPGITSSTFTVSKFVFLNATADGKLYTYLMSGNANLEIMYWQSGTSSTTDVHNLQCVFNNIPVTFLRD